MRNILLFFTALPLIFVLDFAWIGGFAMSFYRQELGSILADSVNWPAAILFYVFFVIALLVFVVLPAMKAKSLTQVLLLGALFGFATYMTYDLTNLATTRDWSIAITLIDMAWGTVLTAIVSMVTYVVGIKFLKY